MLNLNRQMQGNLQKFCIHRAQCDHIIMGQEDKPLVIILNELMLTLCTSVLNKITAVS